MQLARIARIINLLVLIELRMVSANLIIAAAVLALIAHARRPAFMVEIIAVAGAQNRAVESR